MEGEEKTVSVDVDEAFIIKSDAGDLCRLCANTDNQLIPIFKGEGIEHNIPTKIEKHLPIIKVTEIDKLPLQICYQCASTLIAWHNLYEGCLIADKRLREILSISEKGFQEDDTFDNYVDDYRDDYDDQSRSNFDTLPLNSAPSTSNLAGDDLLKSNSIEISQLSESKEPNETELDNTDERYTRTSKTTTTTPPPDHVEPKIENSANTFSKMSPQQSHYLVGGVTAVASEPLCDCTKRTGGVKCATCVERESLKCTLCPMVFVEKADIARHMSSSHSVTAKAVVDEKSNVVRRTPKSSAGRKSVKARVDDDANRWPEEVSASTSASSSSTLHRCKVCLKICLSLRGLTRHSAIHRNIGLAPLTKTDTTFSCNFCDQRFANEDDKRSHVSDYHRIVTPMEGNDENERRSFDSICEVSVKVDEEKENIKNEFGDEIEMVDEAVKSDLEEAKKSTTRKRRRKSEPSSSGDVFACDECDKTFDKKTSYTRHKLTHSTGDEFPCDVCQKRFSSEMVLKRHKSNVHRSKRGKMSDEEDPFSKWYVFADGQKHLKCDQCKYNSLWYHKGRFLEHYRIHTGEKPFTCDLCGKQFRTKTLLQKHVMFVHEGIKEHACDICGRCFSDKRYMEDHRRIHTGERPYVCDLCGKTFKQSASLFIHKELHKGLRKHSCEMCGKRFTTRSSLTIHIKRHVGERNFICATCGKAFVDGKHLKDHMAVHSEERPFSCELCGGRFKLMKHLKQHGRTHKREYAVA